MTPADRKTLRDAIILWTIAAFLLIAVFLMGCGAGGWAVELRVALF